MHAVVTWCRWYRVLVPRWTASSWTQPRACSFAAYSLTLSIARQLALCLLIHSISESSLLGQQIASHKPWSSSRHTGLLVKIFLLPVGCLLFFLLCSLLLRPRGGVGRRWQRQQRLQQHFQNRALRQQLSLTANSHRSCLSLGPRPRHRAAQACLLLPPRHRSAQARLWLRHHQRPALACLQPRHRSRHVHRCLVRHSPRFSSSQPSMPRWTSWPHLTAHGLALINSSS